MTAQLVPFPTQIQTQCPWEEVDKHIRAYLTEIEANQHFINYVGDRMKNFVEKYASKNFEPTFNLIVPPDLSQEQADALLLSIDKGIQNTAEEVQDMISKIIIERLQLEIEIYQNQNSVKYRLC